MECRFEAHRSSIARDPDGVCLPAHRRPAATLSPARTCSACGGEGVTESALGLQEHGLVRDAAGPSRWRSTGLETRRCECHAVVKEAYDRLLPDIMAVRRPCASSASVRQETDGVARTVQAPRTRSCAAPRQRSKAWSGRLPWVAPAPLLRAGCAAGRHRRGREHRSTRWLDRVSPGSRDRGNRTGLEAAACPCHAPDRAAHAKLNRSS